MTDDGEDQGYVSISVRPSLKSELRKMKRERDMTYSELFDMMTERMEKAEELEQRIQKLEEKMEEN